MLLLLLTLTWKHLLLTLLMLLTHIRINERLLLRVLMLLLNPFLVQPVLPPQIPVMRRRHSAHLRHSSTARAGLTAVWLLFAHAVS